MATVPPLDAESAAAAAASRQDFLRDAADMDLGTTPERTANYTLARDYLDGKQRTLLSERMLAYLRRSGLDFSENFLETIVDALISRLDVVGFTSEDSSAGDTASEDGETDDIGAICMDWWAANRMDARQNVVYDYTLGEGDCFVFIDYDPVNQRPRYSVNKPYNCKAIYSDDDPDEMLYAVKVWNTDQRHSIGEMNDPETLQTSRPEPIKRMNVYWPDRVEKWFTPHSNAGDTKAMWFPHFDDGDAGWPVMLTGHDGKPLGIPVVHFRNQPRGRQYGRSEVWSEIPQQDGLNKLILDLHAVADYEGAERWATGLTAEDAGALKRAPGEVWVAGSSEAKFGQFEQAQVDGLLAAINAALSRMSARSSTPLHLLNPTGTLPSGETLKVAEAPLTAKGKDRQTDLGDEWSQVNRKAIRWHNTFGPGPMLDESVHVQTEWDAIESRNDESESRTALNHSELGASKFTILSKLGYNPEVEAERRAEEAQSALDHGTIGGGLPGPMPVSAAEQPVTVEGDATAAA